MHRAMLASLTILALIAALLPVDRALGSIQRPAGSFEQYGPAAPKAGAKAAASESRARKISSYIAGMRQEVLARLSPGEHKAEPIDFDAAQKFLNSKSTLEKIYDKDFEKKMRNEYASKVAPYEGTATNALWRPRSWEMNRYENGRHDLAEWTAREVVDDQLKEFLNGGDQSSAPMKVLTTVREVTGGGDDAKENPAKETEQQKIARAHRTDLPPAKPEEETIPTKLRTKVNVVKGQGAVVFTNPVATTQVKGSTGDGMSLEMNKDFRKLSMKSNVVYGVQAECLNFNLNKKITDRVSLDLDHYAYTGDKRGSNGERAKEQARVNYSISF